MFDGEVQVAAGMYKVRKLVEWIIMNSHVTLHLFNALSFAFSLPIGSILSLISSQSLFTAAINHQAHHCC